MVSEKRLATDPFPESYVNPRGIPRTLFVENIEEFLKAQGVGVDVVLRRFQEQHSKYKLMEHKLTQNLSLLEKKIPEIQRNIETIALLRAKKDTGDALNTHFGITELVYAEAVVPPTDRVHLWLGANVMAEHTLDEAVTLLEKNLRAAKSNVEATLEDLAWLRDQTVICEVNTSRVYNWDVVKRRETAGSVEGQS